MKINSPKKRKKLWLGLILVALIVTIGIILFYYLLNQKDVNEDMIDYQEPTSEQKNSGAEKKKEAVESDSQKPTHNTDTTPSQDTRGTVDVVITAANQAGQFLQVRSLLYGIIDGGTCTLNLSKSDTIVTKTSPIQTLANSTTCEGFDIPLQELSPGTWKLSLTFENSTLYGSTSQEVVIQ